jgi:hypothetical protein
MIVRASGVISASGAADNPPLEAIIPAPVSPVNPQFNELQFLRDRFGEMLRVRGFKARVYIPLSYNRDVANDPNPVWDDPIEMLVVYDQYPTRQVLKSLGWHVERGSDLPILVYFPYYIQKPAIVNGIVVGYDTVSFRPEKYTKVEVVVNTTGDEDFRTFMVTELSASAPETIYWVAKLAPYRQREEFVESSATEDNFTFLNLGDE